MARRNELEKAELAMGAPEAALLYATPGSLRDAVGVKNLVDHYGAGLKVRGKLSPASDIPGPYTRSKTKDTVVSELDRFVFVGKRHEGQNRPEGFFMHYRHRMIDAGNQSWLVERPCKAGGALAAYQYGCAAFHGIIDLVFHELELAFAGH